MEETIEGTYWNRSDKKKDFAQKFIDKIKYSHKNDWSYKQDKTVESYIRTIRRFINKNQYQNKQQIKYQDAVSFIRQMKTENKNIKRKSLEVYQMGLKWYFETILKNKWIQFTVGCKDLDADCPMVEKDEYLAILKKTSHCYVNSKKVYPHGCNHNKCKFQKQRNILLIKFLMMTGARISEVAKLKASHLNRRYPEGWFRDTKRRKNRKFYLNGQKGQEMFDEIHKFIELTSTLAKESKYIFSNGKGNKLSRRSLSEIVKKLVIKCKNEKVNQEITSHSFRRSFATFLHRQGYSLKTIQFLMGHESIQTTQIYIKLNGIDLKKVTNTLDIINGESKSTSFESKFNSSKECLQLIAELKEQKEQSKKIIKDKDNIIETQQKKIKTLESLLEMKVSKKVKFYDNSSAVAGIEKHDQ